jgi:hypothetical protein
MKRKLMEEYKARMGNSKLSEEEKAAMLADLNVKMSAINQEMEDEKRNQAKALYEALARRRAKKEGHRKRINKVTDMK